MDSRQLLQEIRGRPVKFVPGRKVISVLPGEWTSPYEGKGYEPIGYRDFELGDDPRRINIPATARRGVPTIVERVALRDFKVMVIVDPSPSMLVRDKLLIQLAAASLLLYSAWKSETTFGLAVIKDQDVSSFGMGIGSRHFHHLYKKLWGILSSSEDTFSMKGTRRLHLSRCLPPNAMLIYCSDFLEDTGEVSNLTSLKRSVHKYDFIPVIIQDEFEYSFPSVSEPTFIPFRNSETGAEENAWISPEISRKICNAHNVRFQQLITELGEPGTRSIHLAKSVTKELGEDIDKFFRRRAGSPG